MSQEERDVVPPVTIHPVVVHDAPPPRPKAVFGPPATPDEIGVHPPMRMMVGRADREHIDQVRARSIELAYARRRMLRA